MRPYLTSGEAAALRSMPLTSDLPFGFDITARRRGWFAGGKRLQRLPRTGLKRAVSALPFALMRRRVCELANQCGKRFRLTAHESQLSERLAVV